MTNLEKGIVCMKMFIASQFVEKYFGSDQIRCFGGYLAWVVYSVSADCDTDSSGFCFPGPVCDNDADVGGFLVRFHVLWVDEAAGVGSLYLIAVSLE